MGGKKKTTRNGKKKKTIKKKIIDKGNVPNEPSFPIPETNNTINNEMVFNMTNENIDQLPKIIKTCMNDKIKLMIAEEKFSIYEILLERHDIVLLYRDACINYGLLGFLNTHKELYKNGEFNKLYRRTISIAYGQLIGRNNIDMNPGFIKMGEDVSMDSYKALYLKSMEAFNEMCFISEMMNSAPVYFNPDNI